MRALIKSLKTKTEQYKEKLQLKRREIKRLKHKIKSRKHNIKKRKTEKHESTEVVRRHTNKLENICF